ncbi:MAG: hypothetical protein WD184_07320 [Acidimicrobiia bacterium]
MVWEEDDLIEQVRGDDPTLLVGCFLPYLVDVEVRQVPGYVLEGLGDLVAFFESALGLVEFGLEPAELHGEVGFLFGKQVGSDLVGVVEVEQFAPPLLEIIHECGGPVRTPAGYRPGRPPQLDPDRLLQLLIATNQAQTEQRRTFDPIHRPSRLIATLPSMNAAEELAALAVLIHRRDPPAQTTANDAGQRMLALATTALDPSSLRPLPQLFGDDRLMLSGEPLTTPDDFAEVDA